MNLTDRIVLVLEDELIIAFALEDMLADMGATVLLASSIDEASAKLEETQPSLAILDVNLQGTKSYGFAEELVRRGVPVIFATGYGNAEHPAIFAAAPTLTKPYNRQQLALAIEALT